MNPVIFEVGPFAVRWYGVLMGASVAIGAYLAYRQARRWGVNEDHVLTVIPLAIILGLIGARVGYVVTNWGYYATNQAEIIATWHGGLSFHGAIIGGALAIWLYAIYSKISFYRYVDLMVPGVAVGIILVRIGNLINGESMGRAFGSSMTAHPTQIYGSLIGVVLLIIALRQQAHVPPPGYMFWTFVFWYSLLRAVVEETFRDNPLYVWGYVNPKLGIGLFTLTQIVSLPLILLAAYMLWRIRHRATKESVPSAAIDPAAGADGQDG
ncbi:MAG TPA: prolipoprotein diacylglyceryl transferase [Bacillota bacterium]